MSAGQKLQALIKVVKRVWKRTNLTKIQKVIRSWPKRIDMIAEAQGWQIENF